MVYYISTIFLWIFEFIGFSSICYWMVIGFFMYYMPIRYNIKNKLIAKIFKKCALLVASLYAKLTRGDVIYMIDYTKSLYISVVYHEKFNEQYKPDVLMAYVCWLDKKSIIYLNTDGTVDKNNDNYIDRWLYHNKYKRMEMILIYGATNFI